MNSLIIILITGISFLWGYKFYARKLERLWQIDPQRQTPAHTKYDGIDYVPARNWLVLFGHHFSSIAGAGPIIGPVIACALWGWLPAIIWIIAGTIFIGGAHDFGALMCSVRQEGSSISDITKGVISNKAKIIFSVFVWLALILVIAVFTYLCADTFIKEPRIVLPSLGLIPVAMLIGFLLYNVKANNTLATILGLVLLSGLILWGDKFPLSLGGGGINAWIIILLIYCFIASVMPVQILLQPRDYLSSFLLFAGVIFGYAGLAIVNPKITQPAYTAWQSKEGSIWPMMCVTVACGAISGFHSLIASGTTSKQLAGESSARRIGYGAMIAEGFVAVLAVLAVCAGIKDKNLSGLLKEIGPINSFSRGYGEITKVILGGWGSFIAVTILNAFILTTLDTATRISRYLTEELLGIKNRYLATIIVVVLSGLLAISGAWQKIWPVFGASNQLVAALALLVISCWLLYHKKTIKFTIFPAVFMFITACLALVIQAQKYLKTGDYLLFIIASVLLILAGYMCFEAFKVLFAPPFPATANRSDEQKGGVL